MVFKPPFIKQLDGSRYGGLNCTMASAAMAAVRHTRGVNPPGVGPWYPRPADLRARTGDKSGGTTLAQADTVLYNAYGKAINLDIEYNYSWDEFKQRVISGSGVILQGGYAPIRNTKYSGSETFSGNHAVYINEAKWNEQFNRWDFLWYDPLCDGRRSGIPKGPQWMPESLVRAFAEALMLTATNRIARGRVWCAFTADTEDVIIKFGGVKLDEPIILSAKQTTYARRKPVLSSDTARKYVAGNHFKAFQIRERSDIVGGSRVWYGNRDGTQWVAFGRFRKVS